MEILITRTNILDLAKLSESKEAVPVSAIPTPFKTDFDLYFFGKTLTKENDILCAYPHDIKAWVRYVFNKYS